MLVVIFDSPNAIEKDHFIVNEDDKDKAIERAREEEKIIQGFIDIELQDWYDNKLYSVYPFSYDFLRSLLFNEDEWNPHLADNKEVIVI